MKKQFLLIVLWLLSGTVFAQESGLPESDLLPQPVMRIGYGFPYNVTWLPDGKTAAVGTSAGVLFYDTEHLTASPRFLSTSPESAYAIAFNADGSLMATSGTHVQLWDVASGELLEVIPMDTWSSWTTSSIVFSPDNRLLAVAKGSESKGGIQVWDFASGQIIRTFEGHYFPEIVFTADSQDLVAMFFSDAGARTSKFHIETGEETILLENIYDFAVSPDTSEIAHVTYSKEMVITSLDPNSQQGTLNLPAGTMQYRHFSVFWPNANRLMVYKGDALYWIERARLEILGTHEITLPEGLYDVAMSPDGRQLAALGQAGNLYLIDTNTGEIVTQRIPRIPNQIIALSDDNTRLATVGNDNEVWIWDLTTGEQIYTLKSSNDPVVGLAFDDPDTVIVGHSAGTLHFWNRGEKTREINLNPQIQALFFNHPDEVLVISAQKIQLYDLTTGQPKALCTDPTTHESLMEIAGDFTFNFNWDYGGFDYDDENIVMTKWGVTSRWNRETCADSFSEVTLPLHGLYRDIAIQNDILYIASSQAIVGVRENGENWVVTPHTAEVINFVVNGDTIISASCLEAAGVKEGGEICLKAELQYSQLSGGEPLVLPFIHSGGVRDILISSDGRFFVTASEDNTVIVWGNPTP